MINKYLYAAGAASGSPAKNIWRYKNPAVSVTLDASMLTSSGETVRCLAASPDGTKLIAGTASGNIYSVKLDLSGVNWTYSVPAGVSVNSVQVDNDGIVYAAHDQYYLDGSYYNVTRLDQSGSLTHRIRTANCDSYAILLNGSVLWVGSNLNTNGLFRLNAGDLSSISTINTVYFPCGLAKDTYGNVYAVCSYSNYAVRKYLADGTYKNTKVLDTYTDYPATPAWNNGVLCLPLKWTSGSANNPNIFFINAAADSNNMDGTVVGSFDFDDNDPSVASGAYCAASDGTNFWVGGVRCGAVSRTIVITNSTGSSYEVFADTVGWVYGLAYIEMETISGIKNVLFII